MRRAEAADGTPRMHSDNLLALQRAMEAAGVVFLEEGDMRPGGVGVRLRCSPRLAGDHERVSAIGLSRRCRAAAAPAAPGNSTPAWWQAVIPVYT